MKPVLEHSLSLSSPDHLGQDFALSRGPPWLKAESPLLILLFCFCLARVDRSHLVVVGTATLSHVCWHLWRAFLPLWPQFITGEFFHLLSLSWAKNGGTNREKGVFCLKDFTMDSCLFPFLEGLPGRMPIVCQQNLSFSLSLEVFAVFFALLQFSLFPHRQPPFISEGLLSLGIFCPLAKETNPSSNPPEWAWTGKEGRETHLSLHPSITRFSLQQTFQMWVLQTNTKTGAAQGFLH